MQHLQFIHTGYPSKEEKMKTKKDCYDFGDKKICKVCGCTDGSCDCETVEEHKKKEKVT
jgi:hypothetical protein